MHKMHPNVTFPGIIFQNFPGRGCGCPAPLSAVWALKFSLSGLELWPFGSHNNLSPLSNLGKIGLCRKLHFTLLHYLALSGTTLAACDKI